MFSMLLFTFENKKPRNCNCYSDASVCSTNDLRILVAVVWMKTWSRESALLAESITFFKTKVENLSKKELNSVTEMTRELSMSLSSSPIDILRAFDSSSCSFLASSSL